MLTERDVSILKCIHEFRLLRIEQVATLTYRSYTRVHRRLKGLFDTGFLRRIEMPQKKNIYHLGRPAISLLLSRGLITDAEAERRSREHELRPATLDHEMAIADIHVMLEVATKNGSIQFTNWREGQDLRHRFDLETGTVVIQPDASFQLADTRRAEARNRRAFLIEVDLSTMGISPRVGSQRFREKIERYCWFINSGRAFDVHDIRSLRIATLTLTRERRDNLCADTNAFLVEHNLTSLRKFFLFGSISDLALDKPAMFLQPVFRRPGDAALYPLFPPPETPCQ